MPRRFICGAIRPSVADSSVRANRAAEVLRLHARPQKRGSLSNVPSPVRSAAAAIVLHKEDQRQGGCCRVSLRETMYGKAATMRASAAEARHDVLRDPCCWRPRRGRGRRTASIRSVVKPLRPKPPHGDRHAAWTAKGLGVLVEADLRGREQAVRRAILERRTRGGVHAAGHLGRARSSAVPESLPPTPRSR